MGITVGMASAPSRPFQHCWGPPGLVMGTFLLKSAERLLNRDVGGAQNPPALCQDFPIPSLCMEHPPVPLSSAAASHPLPAKGWLWCAPWDGDRTMGQEN